MISREVAQTEVYLNEQAAYARPNWPLPRARMPIVGVLGLFGVLLPWLWVFGFKF